jgi:hypothetical protein
MSRGSRILNPLQFLIILSLRLKPRDAILGRLLDAIVPSLLDAINGGHC